jgi:hypothetical protein
MCKLVSKLISDVIKCTQLNLVPSLCIAATLSWSTPGILVEALCYKTEGRVFET